MRKYLNNPRLVLPLALFALLWVLYSYGLLGDILPKFSSRAAPGTLPVAIPKDNISTNTSGLVMQSLTRQQWLPRNWEKYSAIRNEPFVANYSFMKEAMPESKKQAEPLVEDTVVIMDPEALEKYIAEHLGLDEKGFFVRFGPLYKREGDLLMTSEGRELQLGKIAIPEAQRTDAEHLLSVEFALFDMRLYGVASDSATPDGVHSLVTKVEREDEVAEVFEAQSVLGADSAWIEGGIKDRGIYRQGDLLYMNPVLGLSAVKGDYVEIVDRYGNTFSLRLE